MLTFIVIALGFGTVVRGMHLELSNSLILEQLG